MSWEDRRLETRYWVEKLHDPTGKHDQCWYFVLDPQHDPHARTALLAYSDAVESEYPHLAAQLRAKVALALGGEQ